MSRSPLVGPEVGGGGVGVTQEEVWSLISKGPLNV